LLPAWLTLALARALAHCSISAKMRARTIFRLCHLQMYGAGVFDEALIDPMKTINKVPTLHTVPALFPISASPPPPPT